MKADLLIVILLTSLINRTQPAAITTNQGPPPGGGSNDGMPMDPSVLHSRCDGLKAVYDDEGKLRGYRGDCTVDRRIHDISRRQLYPVDPNSLHYLPYSGPSQQIQQPPQSAPRPFNPRAMFEPTDPSQSTKPTWTAWIAGLFGSSNAPASPQQFQPQAHPIELGAAPPPAAPIGLARAMNPVSFPPQQPPWQPDSRSSWFGNLFNFGAASSQPPPNTMLDQPFNVHPIELGEAPPPPPPIGLARAMSPNSFPPNYYPSHESWGSWFAGLFGVGTSPASNLYIQPHHHEMPLMVPPSSSWIGNPYPNHQDHFITARQAHRHCIEKGRGGVFDILGGVFGLTPMPSSDLQDPYHLLGDSRHCLDPDRYLNSSGDEQQDEYSMHLGGEINRLKSQLAFYENTGHRGSNYFELKDRLRDSYDRLHRHLDCRCHHHLDDSQTYDIHDHPLNSNSLEMLAIPNQYQAYPHQMQASYPVNGAMDMEAERIALMRMSALSAQRAQHYGPTWFQQNPDSALRMSLFHPAPMGYGGPLGQMHQMPMGPMSMNQMPMGPMSMNQMPNPMDTIQRINVMNQMSQMNTPFPHDPEWNRLRVEKIIVIKRVKIPVERRITVRIPVPVPIPIPIPSAGGGGGNVGPQGFGGPQNPFMDPNRALNQPAYMGNNTFMVDESSSTHNQTNSIVQAVAGQQSSGCCCCNHGATPCPMHPMGPVPMGPMGSMPPPQMGPPFMPAMGPMPMSAMGPMGPMGSMPPPMGPMPPPMGPMPPPMGPMPPPMGPMPPPMGPMPPPQMGPQFMPPQPPPYPSQAVGNPTSDTDVKGKIEYDGSGNPVYREVPR